MALERPSSSHRRTRRRPWSPYFEALACRLDGSRSRGTAYRRGCTLTGDACAYQFGTRESDSADSVPDPAQTPMSQAILERLATLLRAEEIDLLYLRHVAGRSPASLARAWHVNRATIGRREDRIVLLLRNDPVLQQLARSRRCATAPAKVEGAISSSAPERYPHVPPTRTYAARRPFESTVLRYPGMPGR